MKNGKSIKISSTGKGYNHYEDYLIKKHKREIQHFLFERDLKASTKRKIQKLYEKKITRDNIICLYTHPIPEFLKNLINNTLDQLVSYTSCTNIN